jgi:hypothetical protein
METNIQSRYPTLRVIRVLMRPDTLWRFFREQKAVQETPAFCDDRQKEPSEE